MKNIILSSYALVSEHPFNSALYELNESYPTILEMRSKNPLSFIIKNNKNKNEYIIYLKLIPNVPSSKDVLEIDELRGFDFKHVVRSVPELIKRVRREGETYEKQMDNYISCFK